MIVTAREAKEKAIKYNNDRFADIMKFINQSAERGKYEMTLYEKDCPDFEDDYFISLGYSVSRWGKLGELITIRWR